MKKLVVLNLLWLLFFGCFSTKPKPNISALYRISEISAELEPLDNKSIDFKTNPLPTPAKMSFQKLYEIDPIIALEVGRIPEFEAVVNGKVKVYQLWENKSVPPRGKNLCL